MVSEKLQPEFDKIKAGIDAIKTSAADMKVAFLGLADKVVQLEEAIKNQSSEAEILAKLEEVKSGLDEAKASVEAIDDLPNPVV